MKKIIFLLIATLAIALGIAALAFFGVLGETTYYTQIDSAGLSQNDNTGGVIDGNGGLAYSYELPCYDEAGKSRSLHFGADKVLKEDAFIQLTVLPLRGVLDWHEVSYSTLPPAVQAQFASPY